MLKSNGKRGTTTIALVAVIALVALAASAAAYFGFGFMPDASWAEGV
jgi:hypothetical protein